MNVTVNYLAVIVAALVPMILGYLWYGPIFGKMWMKAAGKDMSADKKDMAMSYVWMYIASVVMAYVFKHILVFSGGVGLSGAWMGAFWVWLGFFAAGAAHYYLWPVKPFKLYFIDMIYQLISLFLMAWVLMSWI